jgi:hypothetical protein
MKTPKIYQLKISLDEIKPPIWRRIQISERATFWDLHEAIQDSMGWLDCHLNSFFVNYRSKGKEIEITIPDENFSYIPGECLSERKIKISKYFSVAGDKVKYIYDFGDFWTHTILLEKILPEVPDEEYPKCLAGRRASPPEDCGGTLGYYETLEILSNPEHEDYEERLEWLGVEYDPEYFQVSDVVFEDPEKIWEEFFD